MGPLGFLFLILLIALVFYGAIPVLGAFVVRSHWRHFRANLQRSLFYPDSFPLAAAEQGSLGPRRLLGELEAMEGNDIIWIRGRGNRSVTVEMRDSAVYFMPALSTGEKLYPHLLPVPLPSTSLEKVSWADVFSLPEGTRMYISGELHMVDGRYTFRSGANVPLMVLIYNEDPLHLVSRAVWCGRQSNEFWNFLTPWSLLSGILILLILSVYLIQNSGNYILQFLSISMALLPALLFLPPGVFLFNLYKAFWDTARRYRAERDLIRLPVNPEDGRIIPREPLTEECSYSRQPSGWKKTEHALPVKVFAALGDSETTVCYPESPEILARFCQRKAFTYEAFSGIVFSIGLMMNFYVIWIIFNWFF